MPSSLSMVFDLLAVDRASAVFDRVGGSAAAAGREVDAASGSMAAAGSKMATGLGVAGAAIAVISVKMAADFQTNVTKLATTAGEAQGNLKKVSDGMLQMAGQVGIGATELAKGMYTIESSGIHGADALVTLKAAAQGAKQEQADLSHVADALSTVLHDYNLPASTAADTTSKLVEAVAHGKTTFDELTASLHSVTPLAAALHVPLQDILGSLSAMTASGMSADQATQNMADALRHLQAPTAGMTSELAQLGINSADLSAQLGTKGLAGVMQEISDAIIQHLNPATQKVLLPALNQSKTAAADMQTMIGQMPKALADLSSSLLSGQTSLGDYRKQVQGMGGDAGAMGLQFLSLYKSADGFNSLLKSGSPAAQEYSAALYKAVGDSSSLSVALQLTGEHAATTNKAIQDIAKASGDAKGNIKGWDEVQGNFNQQLAQSGAKLGAMAIQLGQALLPALTSTLHFVNSDVLPGIEHMGSAVGNAAHWFSELPGPVKDAALALAALRLAEMVGIFDRLAAGAMRFRQEMALQAALGNMQTAAAGAEGSVGRLGAAMGVASRAASGLRSAAGGLMSAFGGPFGLAIVGVVLGIGALQEAIAKHDAEVKKATDDVLAWNKAIDLGAGGQTAVRAQQNLESLRGKLAAVTEQIDKYNAAAVNGYARGGIGTLVSQQKDLQAELDKGTKAWEDQLAAMTPIQIAQERVTQAEHDLQMAMKDNPPSSQAVTNAAIRLSDARQRLAFQTGLANDAEKDHLKALQDSAQQQLASVNSSLAAQQALMQFSDSVKQYDVDAKDGKHSTEQLAQEMNSLAQQTISVAQAAGQAAADQAKANGVTDTAQASNAAMLKSLQDNEKFLTGPAKAAIDQQIRILQGATIQTGSLTDAVSKMGLTTTATMDNNAAVVKGATEAQIKNFRDLGFTVATLPDHRIVVAADTTAARNAITALTNDYHNYSINLGVGGIGAVYARAAGGPVYGAGTTTSDSIPTLLSHREWVIKASSADKYGPEAMSAVNSGTAMIIPRLAGGGSVADWFLNAKVGIDPASLAAAKHAMAAASTAPGAPGNVSANAALGQMMAARYGWGSGSEWNSLYALWKRESGWNNNAQNPTSTAYGIPQFLNSTWASMGFGKTSDAATQIAAGLKYISQRYGDPIRAWGHETSAGWYDRGGWLMPGATLAMNGTGKPERIRTHEQEAALQRQLSGSQTITLQLDGEAVTDLLEGRVVTALTAVHDRVAY